MRWTDAFGMISPIMEPGGKQRRRLIAGGLAGTGLAVLATVAGGSFAGDGVETLNFGGVDSPDGIAIQKDGRIVAAGSTNAGASVFDFAVARFKRNGDVDNSLSGDGRQTTEFGDFDGADAVAIQRNGRIVAAGTTGADGVDDFAVARYTKAGLPDASFSQDGEQTTDFDEGAGAEDLAIQRNRRIVVAGSMADDFAVARYRPNGNLDKSFSQDGRMTTNFGGFDSASALAIQRNGRIVVAGESCIGPGMGCNSRLVLARYRANGRLDRSFGKRGRKVLGFADGASDVKLQRGGRILVAGNSVPGFAAARLKPGGGLDRSFSKDGRFTTNLGEGDVVRAVAIQRNGKIVLAGSVMAASVDTAVVRLTRRGRLDKSFSGDGKRVVDLAGGSGDGAQDVAFQSRRKFVILGGINPSQDFLVARFRNGRLDD